MRNGGGAPTLALIPKSHDHREIAASLQSSRWYESWIPAEVTSFSRRTGMTKWEHVTLPFEKGRLRGIFCRFLSPQQVWGYVS